MEATGRARIAELEADLGESRSKLNEKMKELYQTQRLLAKLEGAIDKQAKDSQHEQDRISKMEESLAQQQQGTEEKVGKLILAVAGEKHRAELAEKARDEALERVEAARREAAGWAEAELGQLRERLAAEEALRHSAEERARQKEEQVANLELRRKALETPVPEATYTSQNEELEEQLAAEKSLRLEAERKASEWEAKFEALQEEERRGSKRSDNGELSQMVRDLQQQVAGEMGKRMEVQNKLLEKDRKLREAHEELASMAREASSNFQVQAATADGNYSHHIAEGTQRMLAQASFLDAVQERLAEKEGKLRDAEGKLVDKDLETQRLNQQLGEELQLRNEAMKQVADKELQISDLHKAMSGDGISKQQALQGQVIEKEREVCELQQQLADELTRRQQVQYQVIEKERLVCSLQQQLLGSQVQDSIVVNGRRMLELPTHQEFEEFREEYEPDDEESPRPGVLDIYGGSNSYGGSAQSSRLAWGHGPSPQQPPFTPTTVFRLSSSGPNGSSPPGESFGRQYTGPSSHSSHSPQPPKRRGSIQGPGNGGQSGGQQRAFRNSRFVAGGPGAGGGYVMQGGVVSGNATPFGEDNPHSRRLILASRTFT